AFGITVMASVYASDVDRFPVAFAVGATFALLGVLTSFGFRAARIGGSSGTGGTGGPGGRGGPGGNGRTAPGASAVGVAVAETSG
ncbi:MAG TPA: hypothetical protein VGO78_03870, partial [Acidimicrobiales bacterium]|nr:hypothetical protein [Acidimicrobiales bacterium]